MSSPENGTEQRPLILYVEDDKPTAEMMRQLLSIMLRAEVVSIPNPEKAWEIYQLFASELDAVVLDHNVLHTTTEELYNKMTEDRKKRDVEAEDMPIVAYTFALTDVPADKTYKKVVDQERLIRDLEQTFAKKKQKKDDKAIA